MPLYLIGQLATRDGLARQRDELGQVESFRLPASGFRPIHPSPLPLLMGHDTGWPLGEVTWLSRSDATGLLAVAELADPAPPARRGEVTRIAAGQPVYNDGADLSTLLDDGPWYLSPGVHHAEEVGSLQLGHAKLREVSLTRKPAALSTHPILWSRDSGAPGGLSLHWRSAWAKAHEHMSAVKYRRPDRWLLVDDLDPLPVAPAAPQRAALPATATASRRAAPTTERVRLNGVLLDAEQSAVLLDRLDGF